MMGAFRLAGVSACVAVLGAVACGDDGRVIGERSSSGGSSGQSGSSSTGGSSGNGSGGIASTGGTAGDATGGGAAAGAAGTGGDAGSSNGGGGNAGESSGGSGSTSGSGGASGSAGATGGNAGAGGAGAGGAGAGGAGAGGTGAGGTGGTSGANCVDLTCGMTEACVAYRTIGGAVVAPNDAGACPGGSHPEGTYCMPNFRYQCVEQQPRCAVGEVNCACGTCPQGHTACRAPYMAEWLDPSARLVCEQLAG